MTDKLQSHFFLGPHAPLSTLTGAGLLILATTRLAHAIICAGGILWVFIFTTLVFYAAKKIMPKQGKIIILLFLTSFICSVYILLAGFINPLLISGTWFFLLLIPPYCAGSGFFQGLEKEEVSVIVRAAGLDALGISLLVIAVSLIREPLGMGSLSFPGGIWGVHEIFSAADNGGFFPVKILSVSAGGFIILGFGITIFRRLRGEGDKA